MINKTINPALRKIKRAQLDRLDIITIMMMNTNKILLSAWKK